MTTERTVAGEGKQDDESAARVALAHASATAVPPRDAFTKTYDAGSPQVVWTRLVADLETPVSAYLKLAEPGQIGFLLESVEGGATRGRYSIIGLAPDLIFRAFGDQAEVCTDPSAAPTRFTACSEPTLAALRTLLADSQIDLAPELPPMAAGVFGYMGYDTVRLTEQLPEMGPDDLGVPDAILVRPTLMLIFDNVRDDLTVVTPVRPVAGMSADDSYAAALGRLAAVSARLAAPLPHAARMGVPTAPLERPEPVSNTSPEDYLSMVAKAKDYIKAGDIFQVVLSQRFSAPFPLPSINLYRALRRLNPSPFLFHLDFGDFSLVGSSPEILVRVRNGEVTIRPIAGTVRRGSDVGEDRALAESLLADPKERSEHLMLLDLGRNDVGRVAATGTVRVTDQFVIERYSHVMHIVSNVVGRLDTDAHDAIDALMAGFPAGTVSGAPKVRAMEIIAELEKAKRGPYAGCVGYFSANGEMDTCIILRTAIVKDGTVHVQAGAGIVHDSIPENEQQECINKAKAIVHAAEQAVLAAGQAVAPPTGGSHNGGPFG